MKIRNMALCALFAALLCICAWLSIPLGDSFITMQTFGVFLALGLLGGKYGTVAVSLYLLLGATGLPVFSGFRGGAAALLGPTGGYLLGFLATAGVFWSVEKRLPTMVGMVLGLLACYLFGTAWYSFFYLPDTTASILSALARCVLPYLLPDGLKIGLALLLTRKLKQFVY